MFTSTTLRTKLLIALGVPLAALLFVVALRVDDALDRSALADQQQVEIDRVLRIKSVGEALRQERISFSSFSSTADQSVAARAASDQAWEAFITQPGDTPAGVIERLTEIRQFLVDSRPLIPLEPSDFRAKLQEEVMVGATQEGSMTNAVITLIALNKEVDGLARFDADDLLDPQTAQDLTAMNVADGLREDLRTEQSVVVQSSAYPDEGVTLQVLTYMEATIATSERAEASLSAASSAQWTGPISAALTGDAMIALDALRDQAGQQQVGQKLTIDSVGYITATTGVLVELQQLRDDIQQNVIDHADESQSAARNEAITAVGFAGLLLLGLAGLTYALYRSVREPITRLTERSRQIAEVELPRVVETMRAQGADGELPEITPLTADSDDEIGDLVEAFNEMSTTAVALAGEQAASRRVVADMFVNLGRRNQKLLLRMLNQLDGLQAEERDPDRLEQLFAVDHLATRMRRNAESLLVLAGARAARQFNEPVPVGDVLRSALTEVEDYQRVDLKIMHEADVAGGVVADLSHVLAELIENALTFSPSHAMVEVVAVETRNGYTIAVTDQGMGLSGTDIVNANARIAAAASAEETPSKYLGLHVVGRLAARHGLDVELLEGIPSGVTARIRVPDAALGRGDAPVAAGPDASPAGLGAIPAAPVLDALPAAPVAPVAEAVPAALAPSSFPEAPAPAAPVAAEAPATSIEVDHKPAPTAPAVAPDPAPVAEAPAAPAPAAPVRTVPEPVAETPAALQGGLMRRVPGASGLAAERRAATGESAPAAPAAPAPMPAPAASEAPSVFGAVRRAPGQNLPAGAARAAAPVDNGPSNLESALPPAPADPRAIASSLGSFQSATKRADEEHQTRTTNEGDNR
ncbi:MAG: ATP-binding protein [Acidimicrobiales bacterium]